MGDDLTVANVARVSFNKWKTELDDKDVKLIHYLAKHEHTSPFRHTAIQVRCEAPIFLARQLGKHQVGLAWNEVSRRYVDDEPSFWIPDQWRKKPEGSIKQGSSGTFSDTDYVRQTIGWTKDDSGKPIADCFEFIPGGNDAIKNKVYYAMIDALHVYNDLLESGVAPEMARMVLPQSMMTSWIWTGSLQAFFHVWRLRIDGHAQKEAQMFAQMLEDVIKPIFPHSWAALVKSND